MDKLGIKTTLYDVLGYVIPGMMLIVGMYVLFVTGNSNEYIPAVKSLVKVESNLMFGTGIILCSYVLGHVISSIGSFIFENRLMKYLFKKKGFRWLYKINEEYEGENHKEQFVKLVGDKASFSFRSVVAYSEENTKVAYDTAFVFLSIYGLSRNVAVVMLLILASHCFFFENNWDFSFCIVFGIGVVALLHNYFRFKQYYIAQIYASLSSIRNKQ